MLGTNFVICTYVEEWLQCDRFTFRGPTLTTRAAATTADA